MTDERVKRNREELERLRRMGFNRRDANVLAAEDRLRASERLAARRGLYRTGALPPVWLPPPSLEDRPLERRDEGLRVFLPSRLATSDAERDYEVANRRWEAEHLALGNAPLRFESHRHSSPSHHVGPCDDACRRGHRAHAHRQFRR